ncbi:MAG: hypothetical protein HRF43_12730 [Phycisphaerae bacterium]
MTGPAFPEPDPPPASRPTTRPAATRPEGLFQPGIRIDWRERQVEVQVTVILRQGDLELFACSPGNREHEAIVRIEARPTHLYQALGLIGLTPGRPMRYDENEKYIPATGDAVDLDIAYTLNGQPRREPIEHWLERVDGKGPLGRQPWVFAGSLPLEDGRGLAADVEGTVIALVDFPTSLIALAEEHSESNDQWWLRHATPRIPPVGTPARLIIRPAPWRLRLEEDGRLRLHGQPIARADLIRRLAKAVEEDPAQRVEIIVPEKADRRHAKELLDAIRRVPVREEGLAVLDETGRSRPIIP